MKISVSLKKDFERYGSLRSKLKNFEETMTLRELTMSEDYQKVLKEAEKFQAKIRKKRKVKKFLKFFPL